MTGKVHWRCFHCGEAFTLTQKRWAALHFGKNETADPVCQMRVPGEHSLLEALRAAEEQISQYRAEDSDIMRAMHAMTADHAREVRRAEEDGYNRGVRDSMKESGS